MTGALRYRAHFFSRFFLTKFLTFTAL